MTYQTERIDIQRSLGRIEGKLDSLTGVVAVHVSDDNYNFKELKTRVSILEKKMWVFLGAIAMITSFPAIAQGVTYFIHMIK